MIQIPLKYLILLVAIVLFLSGYMARQGEINTLKDSIAWYQNEQNQTYEWLHYQLWELEQNYLMYRRK